MQYQRLPARGAVLVGLATVLLATGCAGLGGQGSESPSVSAPPATRDAGGSPPPDAGEPANEEAAAPGPLMLIMDASGSMNETGTDGQLLIDSAKQALHDLVDALPAEQHVGLRVYGHTVPNTDEANGCQDTELIHPVAPLDRNALNQAIDSYHALGYTPIGLSLEQAAGDLPPEGNRTIVLVSDGEDTCAPPDPCEVSRNLNQAGVELIVNTVGFALGGNQQARQELECIAEAGGGVYQDADTAAELADALEESTRDRREAQLAGDVFEGAPLPRDANTGQVNTQYRDTVLGDEDNWYRFDITPGSEVRAEVIASYARPVDSCRAHNIGLALTDAGEQAFVWIPTKFIFAGDARTIRTPETVTTGQSEIFLQIETGGAGCADAELDVEFQLAVL